MDKTLQKVEQSLFDAPQGPERLPVGQPVEPKGEATAEAKAPRASAGDPTAAEAKALRLEQLLEAATAREAVSSSERLKLRKQLERGYRMRDDHGR